jgi:hypothetical protein
MTATTTTPRRRRSIAASGGSRSSAGHTLAVAGLAAVFAYQGLVPKVWKVDAGEVQLWRAAGVSDDRARLLVRCVGVGEASFAVATVVRSDRRWPFVVAMTAMPVLAAGASAADRTVLTHAFNPGSLGIAVAALAGVALATLDQIHDETPR